MSRCRLLAPRRHSYEPPPIAAARVAARWFRVSSVVTGASTARLTCLSIVVGGSDGFKLPGSTTRRASSLSALQKSSTAATTTWKPIRPRSARVRPGLTPCRALVCRERGPYAQLMRRVTPEGVALTADLAPLRL